jgi:hypothetical protein
VKEVAELADAVPERGENESAVRDGLGAGGRELEMGVRWGTRSDSDGGGKGPGNHVVLNARRALLERLPDTREDDNLLDVAGVLLVDSHNVEERLDVKTS